jgi:DNA repair protein RadC
MHAAPPLAIAPARGLLRSSAMPTSIKQLPSAERPRERLRASGSAALSDVELVAVIFGGDLACAGEVVARLGGAVGIGRALVAELCEVPGVGPARACQIRAAVELGARAVAAAADPGLPLRSAAQVRELLRDLVHVEQEELHVLALDARHRLVGRFVAARGQANVVLVSPRDVFRRLLREGASGAIFAHNHPSGDPAPSEDDVRLTERLRAGGELLGVPLIDHVILASEGCFSFTQGCLAREPGLRRGGGM